jgi:hypothetical protein
MGDMVTLGKNDNTLELRNSPSSTLDLSAFNHKINKNHPRPMASPFGLLPKSWK